MPAGIHMLDIAYKSAEILMKSLYGQYCPNMKNFVILSELRKIIMKNPAKYHIRAFCLTGAAKVNYVNTWKIILVHLQYTKTPH